MSHRPGMPKTLRARYRLIVGALNRADWRCHYCERGLMLKAILGPDESWWKSRQHNHGDGLVSASVDHIEPVATRTHRYTDPSNVVAACRKCNQRRAAPETAAHENGRTTRVQWEGREYVRDGRRWVPAEDTP